MKNACARVTCTFTIGFINGTRKKTLSSDIASALLCVSRAELYGLGNWMKVFWFDSKLFGDKPARTRCSKLDVALVRSRLLLHAMQLPSTLLHLPKDSWSSSAKFPIPIRPSTIGRSLGDTLDQVFSLHDAMTGQGFERGFFVAKRRAKGLTRRRAQQTRNSARRK